MHHIAQFWFDSALPGKHYLPKLKIKEFKFSGVSLPTSLDNVSNYRNASPCTSVRRYWIFAPYLSVPDALRVMLKLRINNKKLQINNKKSLGSPLSNKAILNSYRSDFYDDLSLISILFKTIIRYMIVFNFFISGTCGGSACTCTVPVFNFFLHEMFIVVNVLVLLWIY